MKHILLLVVGLMVACVVSADEVVPLETRFQYDAVNRITNTWNSRMIRQTFVYDAVGNVLSKQVFGPPTIISLVTNPVMKSTEKFSIPFQVTYAAGPVMGIVVSVKSGPFKERDCSIEGRGDVRWLHISPPNIFENQSQTVILTASDGYISNSVPVTIRLLKK